MPRAGVQICPQKSIPSGPRRRTSSSLCVTGFILTPMSGFDGKPCFSIYELQTLIQSFGGLEQTRVALQNFRARTKAAGLPGLHLNIIGCGLTEAIKLLRGNPTMAANLSGAIRNEAALAAYLKIGSVTWYTWAHVALPEAPTETYEHWAARSEPLWSAWQDDVKVPFYSHVKMGWDGSPRDYSTGIVIENSPTA
jgi:hypothetical protein